MANIPTNVSFGTVVGQFIASIGDTSDVGREPDAIPVQGTILFTPQISSVKNISASPNPVTIVKTSVAGVLDDEGYLCNLTIDPETGFYQRGVPLVATDDPDINPSGWTWKVSYTFSLNGRQITSPISHSIEVPAGETIDLTEVSPVVSSAGEAIVRGPQGEPGDLVPTSSAVWTGTVALADYPRTYLTTLTGNVTSIALPASPSAEESGTITLVVTQDAVGNRTIAWPVEILWPEAIEPQPAPGANSVSLFNLMWTGQNWLGFLGGRSFA